MNRLLFKYILMGVTKFVRTIPNLGNIICINRVETTSKGNDEDENTRILNN